MTVLVRPAPAELSTAPRPAVRPGVLPPPGLLAWVEACPVQQLVPGRGVAVLLPDRAQAALFLQPTGMIYAIDNIDPYSGAAVLSRGLTGDRAGEPTVASPLLKQVFSLRTGQALDEPEVSVRTYAVRVLDGVIRIGDLATGVVRGPRGWRRSAGSSGAR
ncbi:nitrite reductase small subunit NirD [Intrasporangium calvum]|uniref:Nitrite reductase small subunit NirD n=1 Tax=Intrasporangium calvum TaxID=53358 RepID=A0ABT5GIJ5_9MICO|nr:nitrite reductase small subunit NirD [Intrasporangium calvum]MDC5698031.1 nitrite reductase small subunit NirD [Intrasporangium calvum]